VSVKREQKGTPDKVSKYGDFQHLKIFLLWRKRTHLIPQIDISVEHGQKGTPDKVSESGNISTLEKFPGME
jgi:hypothetical protein